jgi:hypothetical protein
MKRYSRIADREDVVIIDYSQVASSTDVGLNAIFSHLEHLGTSLVDRSLFFCASETILLCC